MGVKLGSKKVTITAGRDVEAEAEVEVAGQKDGNRKPAALGLLHWYPTGDLELQGRIDASQCLPHERRGVWQLEKALDVPQVVSLKLPDPIGNQDSLRPCYLGKARGPYLMLECASSPLKRLKIA